ncbi:MAG: hypothetical protein A3G34_00105 [Candidatus Lindowbacteria bacterium RIFCSPLOWO2_12_FULL_62_27]|nr:MAG: hypothetical protein A3G34_00105 [Candidatus Lindowbacteria bacterium RIFCSPLOWO2_12_FULL_62_27]OGH56687.1 MAG: hypothetical protein A3I06_07545 [Candidatus Lindowbacteria bacterium RIFCSPLOWO2_02_FULL_62_12]
MRRHYKPNGAQGSMLLSFLLSMGAVTVVFGSIIESSLLLHARTRMFNDAQNAVVAAADLYFSGVEDPETLQAAVRDQYCVTTFLDAGATRLDFSRIADHLLILHSAKPVPFLFLPDRVVLNVSMAAVIPQVVYGLSGLVPFAVVAPEGGFVYGELYTLKFGGGDGQTGNYGALALDGSGASNYLDKLEFGYDQVVRVGDVLTTEPGNMKGPTDEGISYRLDQGNDVIFVVVTDQLPNGRGEIVVRGFAAFRVQSATARGDVTGDFIEYRTSGEAGPGANDYGLYTRSRLVFF